MLGLAFRPMIQVPLSEDYGKNAVYIVRYGIDVLFLLTTTLERSLGGSLLVGL